MQRWSRDDAHGTWNSAKAVSSTTEADEEPKQQASFISAAGEGPVEGDMDEVHPLSISCSNNTRNYTKHQSCGQRA